MVKSVTTHGPTRRPPGIGVRFGLVLALAAIVSLVFWFLPPESWSFWPINEESWIEQPVMLRILEGEVELASLDDVTYAPAADMTWLNAGSQIWAKRGSLSILQFFDGSAVQIEGPAQIGLTRSQSLTGRDLSGPRSISIEVVLGRVTVAAARQTSRSSLFELRTPNSFGQVQASLFVTEVYEDGGAVWESSRGTVRVGAMTADRDSRAVVALIRLNARDSVAVAPVPRVWQSDQATADALATVAAELVAKSVRRGSPDVHVDGVSLQGMNLNSGNAVFRVIDVKELATVSAAIPELPPDHTATRDEILEYNTRGLMIAATALLKSPFLPALPTPEVWSSSAKGLLRKSPPHYLFSIYGVEKPLGVAVDPAGQRICVTESSGERLTRVFNRDGTEIMVLAPPSVAAGERDPSYVAMDSMGTVFVSDRMRQTIDMYDVNGDYLGPFGLDNGASTPVSPLGLALDPDGNLYVTDVADSAHRVMVFDSSGKLKLEFGGVGDANADLSFPNDVAVDSSGRIYVADSNNFRLRVFDANGQFLAGLAGASVGFPRGAEIDGRHLYVVDTFGHTVHVYDIKEGMKPLFDFGERGFRAGQFNYPNGFALDSTSRLYVTDRENDRVQVWGY